MDEGLAQQAARGDVPPPRQPVGAPGQDGRPVRREDRRLHERRMGQGDGDRLQGRGVPHLALAIDAGGQEAEAVGRILDDQHRRLHRQGGTDRAAGVGLPALDCGLMVETVAVHHAGDDDLTVWAEVGAEDDPLGMVRGDWGADRLPRLGVPDQGRIASERRHEPLAVPAEDRAEDPRGVDHRRAEGHAGLGVPEAGRGLPPRHGGAAVGAERDALDGAATRPRGGEECAGLQIPEPCVAVAAAGQRRRAVGAERDVGDRLRV